MFSRPWLARISRYAVQDPSHQKENRCRSRCQRIFAMSINSYQVSPTRAQLFASHSLTSTLSQTRHLLRQSQLKIKSQKHFLQRSLSQLRTRMHLWPTSYELAARTAANRGRVPPCWPAVRRRSAFSCLLRRCSRAGKGGASSRLPPQVRSTQISSLQAESQHRSQLAPRRRCSVQRPT